VDAADLNRQIGTRSRCIPPALVSLLLARGHGNEVAYQASRGEWFCARAQAGLLIADSRPDEAADVLGPYIATGSWPVAEFAAVLLEQAGRLDEALELVHTHARVRGQDALALYARILARHSRAEEAFSLLAPHVRDRTLAEAMVEIAGIADRDAHAARLLEAEIAADERGASRRPIDAWLPHDPHAQRLLAVVHERQGRIQDAIDLLRTRDHTPVNGRDLLADLLARHGLIDELRAYARGDSHGHATQQLAEALEERGEIDQAIAVYREPAASPARQRHAAVHLAQILARHGRGEEAIAGLAAFSHSPAAHGADESVDAALCDLYIQQHRAADGLAYLDKVAPRYDAQDWDHLRLRLKLMAAAGQREEAVAKARAHPDASTGPVAACIARLLADAGRIEEAVCVLEQSTPADRSLWARYLIELTHVKQAIAVLQHREPSHMS
jgi:tetratricopeptide (TPR) repeat protein